MTTAGRPSPVGRTRDAGWQIGVSTTVDRPVGQVWDFLVSPAGLAVWLGSGVTLRPERGAGYQTDAGVRGETRGFRDRDRVRLTWRPAGWAHDTTLQLTVSPAARDRTRLGVHQERLADADEREQQRRHWQGVLDALVRALEPPAG